MKLPLTSNQLVVISYYKWLICVFVCSSTGARAPLEVSEWASLPNSLVSKVAGSQLAEVQVVSGSHWSYKWFSERCWTTQCLMNHSCIIPFHLATSAPLSHLSCVSLESQGMIQRGSECLKVSFHDVLSRSKSTLLSKRVIPFPGLQVVISSFSSALRLSRAMQCHISLLSQRKTSNFLRLVFSVSHHTTTCSLMPAQPAGKAGGKGRNHPFIHAAHRQA